jgi:hypothetical protein
MSVRICRLGVLVAVSVLAALPAIGCSPGEKQPQQTADNRGSSDAGGLKERQGKDSTGKTFPPDAELLAEGKKAWRPCAACHCATDPRIKEDEDWVKLNEETTCIEAGEPAPRVRKSIIAYLRHPDTLRPLLVDENFKPGEGKKTAPITVPAAAGSAHLKAERNSIKDGSPSMVRLHWHETKEEKLMVAPSGEYIIINYWLYRTSGKNGEERWMVTGTNVDGCDVVYIEPDEEASLNLDAPLHGMLNSTRTDKGFTLSFSVYDTWGNRLTLSKNGRLVMPGYRILDGEGKVLAEGKFGVI